MLASCVLFLSLLFSPPLHAQEISLRNANFYLPQEDFAIQKPGAPLQLIRSYNSRSNEQGRFGYGWSTPFDTVVRLHADGSILVVDADGFVLRYTLNGTPWSEITKRFVDRLVEARKEDDRAHGHLREDAWYDQLRKTWNENPNEREQVSYTYRNAWIEPVDGTYLTSDRGSETLVRKGDVYTRTRADGLIETFNADGFLVSRMDPAGHGLRFDWDRNGLLTKVSHTDGASFTLTYNKDGRVSEVKDTEGRSVSYQYDDKGNLIQVKGPGKRITAYVYDDGHNLVAVRQADGSGIQIQYDTVKDWAIALKKGEQVTRYEWQLQDGLADRYTAIVTAPDGSRTKYIYDERAHTMEVVDPRGRVTRTLYSSCCEKPVEVVDPDGRVTRYEYDQRGRMTSVSRPDGITAKYEYDPQFNRILKAGFSDGRRFTYTYDEGGRITKVDAGNRVLALKYGSNGKVSEIESSDGKKYSFKYDADGRPVKIVGAKGIALELSYGVTGSLIGSQISTPSSSAKQAFYKDLQDVLDMLEPATGSF